MDKILLAITGAWLALFGISANKVIIPAIQPAIQIVKGSEPVVSGNTNQSDIRPRLVVTGQGVTTTNLYVSGTASIPGISSGSMTSTNFYNSGQFTNDGSATLNGTTTINSAGGLVVNGPFSFTTGAGVITNITSTNIKVDYFHIFPSSTLGIGATNFESGQYPSSMDYPLMISHKLPASGAGLLTVLGWNVYNNAAGATVVKNTALGGWAWVSDARGNTRPNLQLLGLNTASTNKTVLTITQDGLFGIGTTTPFGVFQVATTTANATTTMTCGKEGQNKGCGFTMVAQGGTLYCLMLNPQGGFVTTTGYCAQ